MKSKSFYYTIPAELAEAGKPTKALLYGIIANLCRNQGHCWASNSFLAKKLGFKSKGNVSGYIQELKRESWITIQYKNYKRKIFTHSPTTITDKGLCENRSYPYGGTEESIIKSNIKKNNFCKNPVSISSGISEENLKQKIIRKKKLGLKPYYYGSLVVVTKNNKTYAIIDEEWKEFVGKEKDIEWKKA